MKHTKAMIRARFYDTFAKLGFTFEETETLRRAEMTLSRWSEHECNGYIQRDEATGIPYTHSPIDGRRYGKAADREKGALARVAKLMQAHPGLIAYHQGDPRGCSLYIVRASDVPAGEDIGAYYTRGFAVCY